MLSPRMIYERVFMCTLIMSALVGQSIMLGNFVEKKKKPRAAFVFYVQIRNIIFHILIQHNIRFLDTDGKSEQYQQQSLNLQTAIQVLNYICNGTASLDFSNFLFKKTFTIYIISFIMTLSFKKDVSFSSFDENESLYYTLLGNQFFQRGIVML